MDPSRIRGDCLLSTSRPGLRRRVVARAFLGVLPPLFLAASALPSQLSSQANPGWRTATTIAFGGLGCWAAGLASSEATREAEREGSRGPVVLISTLGGCVGGGYVGWRTGKEVDSLLADGRELPTGLRRGAQLGTVLAGATLGSLIGLIPASQQEGERTRIVATWALAGAAAGAVAQVILNGYLDPDRSAPSLDLGWSPERGFFFARVYRF